MIRHLILHGFQMSCGPLPLEELAMKYDTVEEHGWYDNWFRPWTCLENHGPDELILDYSGGTGILVDRLFRAERPSPNVMIVDSSPYSLRLALKRTKTTKRWAFTHPISSRKTAFAVLRGSTCDSFYARKADGLHRPTRFICTIASTDLRSWKEALRVGAKVHIQSGNIQPWCWPRCMDYRWNGRGDSQDCHGTGAKSRRVRRTASIVG